VELVELVVVVVLLVDQVLQLHLQVMEQLILVVVEVEQNPLDLLEMEVQELL